MKELKKEKIIVLMIVLLFTISLGLFSCIERTYTREVTVTRIVDNNIFAEDAQKNIWSFTGNNFSVGEKITLIMDDYLTFNNVNDDKIKRIIKNKN